MKKFLTLCMSMIVLGTFHAVATDPSSKEMEKTHTVPTGTYEGTAIRVDDDEKEIYFKTEDGKILELYFKKETKLMKDGEKVEFEVLEKGQSLKVKVETKGDRTKPVEVTIIAVDKKE